MYIYSEDPTDLRGLAQRYWIRGGCVDQAELSRVHCRMSVDMYDQIKNALGRYENRPPSVKIQIGRSETQPSVVKFEMGIDI